MDEVGLRGRAIAMDPLLVYYFSIARFTIHYVGGPTYIMKKPT